MYESLNDKFCRWKDRLFDKGRSVGRSSVNSFKRWHKKLDQNALEKELAQIIETANSHQAKGLPKGSPAYIALRDQAVARIQTFAEKWGVSAATIEAQAPALADLHSLCVPDKQIPAGIKLMVALIGTTLLLLLIGAASGLVQAGHDWVMHLFVR